MCQVKSQTVAFRYSSASDVSAVVPYSCRQTAAQSVATVVLFSIVSVCGSLGVCLCVIVNVITPQPFHKIYMAARYQQRTNRQKQSKDSQNSKNDHWCTNRHMSIKTVPTAYQSSKTVNNSQKTVKSAKITIGVPIVTMSTQSPPNTQSPRLLCVCSTLGLANRAVSPSQSEGVRVVAELRHSST